MRKTVFLSSTGADLSDYRRCIIEQSRGYDWFHLDYMEDWGARNDSAIPFCRTRVEEAHALVALIGSYRGWEPKGDNKRRSITEMEYDWASDAGKPRLMFVAPDDFAGAAPASEGAKAKRQARFRARLKSEHVVDGAHFNSGDNLAAAVFRAITNRFFYEIAAQAAQGPTPATTAPSPAAAVADALAGAAEEENLTVKEMKARGFGLDKIEAILTKQKHAATARMAQHRKGEAEARKDAALAAKRLGALAFFYDTAKALAAYAEAAELDPDDWQARWRLGQIQIRAGNLAGAKASFERLITLHPTLDNPYHIHWSHFLLGDVEAKLGNRDAALNHYERGQTPVQALLDKDQQNTTWKRDLSVSYNKIGDISAARDPENAEWQRDLSISYEKIGDISAAILGRMLPEAHLPHLHLKALKDYSSR